MQSTQARPNGEATRKSTVRRGRPFVDGLLGFAVSAGGFWSTRARRGGHASKSMVPPSLLWLAIEQPQRSKQAWKSAFSKFLIQITRAWSASENAKDCVDSTALLTCRREPWVPMSHATPMPRSGDQRKPITASASFASHEPCGCRCPCVCPLRIALRIAKGMDYDGCKATE